MKKTVGTLVTFLFLAMANPSSAKDIAQLCQKDARSFCGHVYEKYHNFRGLGMAPGQSEELFACMEKNMKKLSPSCRALLQNNRKQR